MRTLALLVSLVLFSFNASAEPEAKQVSGHCGDHYFKVNFTADLKTNRATLSYSGDSGEVKEFTGTIITEDLKGPSFRINFTEPEKGYLDIDGSDYYHNIYWGGISKTGKSTDQLSLGLCSVVWDFE